MKNQKCGIPARRDDFLIFAFYHLRFDLPSGQVRHENSGGGLCDAVASGGRVR
jgi:hypothetical protein